ncbi:MAG: tRNA (guanosine(46)-N7)-methyltransferase TrmB [Gammaproteobacteria bacterium]|jgi:tRNA (guanine-N7-)-methyltransferase
MEPTHNRSIRSYVLRQGRLTDGQANALERYWPKFGIEFSTDSLNLPNIFHRNAPKILDIGTGMGETLIELAGLNCENDYLAIEVHRPGVGSLIRNAAANNLGNIRVINHDVMDVLQHQLADNSLDQVYIFFCDPWPKKRHHKRRLVNHEFLSLLIPKLKLNARIFLATDWEDLANHLLEVCDHHPGLRNIAGKNNFTPRPQWRPLTKFEQRGKKLDHDVWDLCYCPA